MVEFVAGYFSGLQWLNTALDLALESSLARPLDRPFPEVLTI